MNSPKRTRKRNLQILFIALALVSITAVVLIVLLESHSFDELRYQREKERFEKVLQQASDEELLLVLKFAIIHHHVPNTWDIDPYYNVAVRVGMLREDGIALGHGAVPRGVHLERAGADLAVHPQDAVGELLIDLGELRGAHSLRVLEGLDEILAVFAAFVVFVNDFRHDAIKTPFGLFFGEAPAAEIPVRGVDALLIGRAVHAVPVVEAKVGGGCGAPCVG